MMDVPRELPLPFVIGVAGGVGAGKSRVARAFAGLGCLVLDADEEIGRLLRRGDVVGRIADRFGEGVLDSDGGVDRPKLGGIVFGDAAARGDLEAILHPEVIASCRSFRDRVAAAGVLAGVLDVPLLFEVGLDSECDVLVFVRASLATRLRRVERDRGWDAAELDRRQAAQLDLEEKRDRCHAEIVNDEESADDGGGVDTQARALFDTLAARASSRD